MRGRVRLSLFSGLFIAIFAVGTMWRAVPAIADGAGDAAIIAAINTSSAAQIAAMRQVILGTGVGTPTPVGVDENKVPIMTPATPLPYTSLAGFFDTQYMNKNVGLNQVQTANNQQFAMMLGQNQTRNMDATNNIGWNQDVKKTTLGNSMDVLERGTVACPRPSMGQSVLGFEEIVQQERERVNDEYNDETSGTSAKPEYAKGPLEYAKKFVATRNEKGFCTKEGGDGTDAEWCDKANDKRKNWDFSPETLLGKKLLQTTNPDERNYLEYAAMYIKNMFPNRSFSPIRASLLKPMSPEAAEILTERAAYSSLIGTFMKPYSDAQTERTGIPDAKALTSLDAALTRAGYQGAAKDSKLAEGKTSLAAMDYIRYKVYYHDPQTSISELNGPASMNIGNTLVIMANTAFDQTTLLYDIREEIKKTNILLGAMGSVLSRSVYEDVQAQAQGVTASAQ